MIPEGEVVTGVLCQVNMAPGFAEAKSSAGALRMGPLLAVGNAAAWPQLGEAVSRVVAVEPQ